MQINKSVKLNIYRANGTWYAALWVSGEFDSVDELGCADEASEAEAIDYAGLMSLSVIGPREIERVADVDQDDDDVQEDRSCY